MIDVVWQGLIKSGMWNQARENALAQVKNFRENYDLVVDVDIATNISHRKRNIQENISRW